MGEKLVLVTNSSQEFVYNTPIEGGKRCFSIRATEHVAQPSTPLPPVSTVSLHIPLPEVLLIVVKTE